MHIGMHCYEYPPCNHGGVGSYTRDLAESLVKKGYQVTVFGFYFDFVLSLESEIDEQINGVRIIRLPQYKKFSNNRLNYLFGRSSLYKLIKKINREGPIDVIESPEGTGWLPWGVPLGIPLITRLHGGQAYFGKELGRSTSSLARWAESRQIKKSQRIVAVSDYVGKKTLNILKINKKYQVIYNSVPDYFGHTAQPKVIDKNLIVFVGSIDPKKGVKQLLLAMNIVMSEYKDVKLVLAGKNNIVNAGVKYEDYLRGLIEDEFNTRVSFTGNIDRKNELIPLLQKAQVCCFPSHVEAFALAPLEAMSLGKAIVNTNLASGSEVIVDGESGLLCNPKDPTDIADKLITILNNQKLAQELGRNAKKRIKSEFGSKKCIESNIKLYQSVIKEK